MNRISEYRQYTVTLQNTRRFLSLCLIFIVGFHGITSAEGTKQLEPPGAPANSVCKLVLSQNFADNRIPFALLNCSPDYRLNIRINDHTTENIYLGFGNMVDYFDGTVIYTDVNYRIKDPTGKVVDGFSLSKLPDIPGNTGFIDERSQAEAGPDINGTNPDGYIPLVLDPLLNGDYVIEFQLPSLPLNTLRVFNYIDITVAKANHPIPGRLWSKAWQLGTGSVTTDVNATYSLFYIYTNDSIVTRFDCNGLAGGVWTIYSNEWGCSTTGTWSDRRQSIPGNATVIPQYKIFLNDPDPLIFPSGHIGEMIDFKILEEECDTVITFATHVSKGGNIEIMLDAPPSNPGSVGPEDVQLGYNVTDGYNVLLPAWDGKNAYGDPIGNGTSIIARISFLNGLSNVPLYDVEDTPKGFKVDIQRPAVSGSTKLKLFWDDTQLPPRYYPSSNITKGCLYTGTGFQSGCHQWTRNQGLGDTNTINSWWYLTTDQVLDVPITLKIRPSSGSITAPASICDGQQVSFRTSTISYARQYIWHLSGPGVDIDFERDAPDTTLTCEFPTSLVQGNYILSVFGRNPQCFDGEKVFHTAWVYDYVPGTVNGSTSACKNTSGQYEVSGSYSNVHWSVKNGQIVGSADANSVTVNWHTTGKDTLLVTTTSNDCGKRLIKLPIEVHPEAIAGFYAVEPVIACPGVPVSFCDTSFLQSGKLLSRSWEWNNSHTIDGNDSLVTYIFPTHGVFEVKLMVTTDHGCLAGATKQINIMPAPEASFSTYSNCISQPIQLLDNSTGAGITSWNWAFGSAPATTSGLSLRQPAALFHSTGQFPIRLVVGNSYGCNDTVIQQVIIHNRPVAQFIYEYPCQGTQIAFTDLSQAADGVLTGFTWGINSGTGDEGTFLGNPAIVVFKEAVNYTVTHTTTDSFGCSDTVSQIIKINPRPDAAFEIIENPNNNGELHFDNQTTGATEYSWNFGNGISSTLMEPLIQYDREGDYAIMLRVINYEGCMDTAVGRYYYMPGFWLPNAFSPDNDGNNDIFRPVTQRNTLEPYEFLVFDRWGQMIFKTTTPEVGWDGKYNGEPCQAGSYTYLVQYREGKIESSEIVTKRGMVSLIR